MAGPRASGWPPPRGRATGADLGSCRGSARWSWARQDLLTGLDDELGSPQAGSRVMRAGLDFREIEAELLAGALVLSWHGRACLSAPSAIERCQPRPAASVPA